MGGNEAFFTAVDSVCVGGESFDAAVDRVGGGEVRPLTHLSIVCKGGVDRVCVCVGRGEAFDTAVHSV